MTVFAFVLAAYFAGSSNDSMVHSSDSSVVVGVVASFHAALRIGDSTRALRLLDRDAIILESGAAETRGDTARIICRRT